MGPVEDVASGDTTILPREPIGGRYRLTGLLGRGGMANVYLAQDERLGREVAVKILTSGSRSTAQFRREARRAASIAHPNLVAVHDTGEHEGTPYIVMEPVSGPTLREALERGRPSEPRALEIAEEACQALEVVHRNGLVHADVTPANILLVDDGRVKMTDFGIARAAGDDAATQRSVLGTVAYASPEHVRGEPLDSRSDLYGLGVVLYEMLAGRPPFAGETVSDVASGHLSRTPRPIAGVAPETSAIVSRALAKDPRDRYPSATAMRADLRRALGESVPLTTAVRLSLRQRLSRLSGVAGLAVGLALVSGVAGVAQAPESSVRVPDLVGEDYPTAAEIVEEDGLVVGDVHAVDAEPDASAVVVSQRPPPGMEVSPRSPIDVVVASIVEPAPRTGE